MGVRFISKKMRVCDQFIGPLHPTIREGVEHQTIYIKDELVISKHVGAVERASKL